MCISIFHLSSPREIAPVHKQLIVQILRPWLKNNTLHDKHFAVYMFRSWLHDTTLFDKHLSFCIDNVAEGIEHKNSELD